MTSRPLVEILDALDALHKTALNTAYISDEHLHPGPWYYWQMQSYRDYPRLSAALRAAVAYHELAEDYMRQLSSGCFSVSDQKAYLAAERAFREALGNEGEK